MNDLLIRVGNGSGIYNHMHCRSLHLIKREFIPSLSIAIISFLFVLSNYTNLWGQSPFVFINNSEFEETDTSGEILKSWSYLSPDKGSGSLTVGKGHNSKNAAMITCTKLDGAWGPGLKQVGLITLKESQWYEISFWARSDSLTGKATVGFRNINNLNADPLWRSFVPNSEWKIFKFKFYSTSPAIPTLASRLQFHIDSKGTLWIDDVHIIESMPEVTTNVVDVAGRKNRVRNSSFELGTSGWATYGVDELYGEIDDSTSAHGKQSFKITLDNGKLPILYNDFQYVNLAKASHYTIYNLPLCTLGYLPINKNQAVTASFYMKASRNDITVLSNLIEDTGRASLKKLSPTTQWQRYSFTVFPQSDLAFITIGIDADAHTILPLSLWLDSIQVELGESPTTYEPSFPVEAAINTNRESNIYLLGDKLKPQIDIINYTGNLQNIRMEINIEDFFNKQIKKIKVSKSLKSGQNITKNIDWGITDCGFYRINLRTSGDNWKTSQSIRTAIIYPFEQKYKTANGFLGINHAFVSDLFMKRVKSMGVTWVRSWFAKWEDVEPQKGYIDFSEANLQYNRLNSFGFNVLLCLSDPSSEWASTAPVNLKETTGGESQSRRVWWLPKSFNDYENYVYQTALEFKDKVNYYEILNEATDGKGGPGSNLSITTNYSKFVNQADRAIRRISEDNHLITGGLYYYNVKQDKSTLIQSIDIFGEHRYPGLAPTSNILSDLSNVHAKLTEAGEDKPIWMTEYGVYADDDPDPTTVNSTFLEQYGKESEKLAATAIAKHHIIALASGVEKIFFHIGNWPFLVNREHNCGFHPFFEWGGVPRKTYSVLNTLAWMLPPSTKFINKWQGPSGFYGFEFNNGSDMVVALWAEENLNINRNQQAFLNKSGLSFTNIAGAELKKFPVVIEDSPIYIVATNSQQKKIVTSFLQSLTAGVSK